ncbi:MAG: ABC transporter ATP-binding protein [Mesorhizobium sp.]|uniref:ABC transporter ATP-binding protein n=1 Tax=Mesorhizobium sp. TaxID=1871066 RepID=UPI000FE71529|nr:ABC transporter ATP-binding protein [Mesorhizobium sp.]RWI57059.1 MAG: ABC transporter ATP-binding protein [Mesorhizobium sp.]
MPEPLLSIDCLSSGYGDFQALFEISFELQQGQVMGLAGANGAGKSTFFKAVMGLLPRTKGAVRFQGKSISGVPADTLAKRGLVMVPEGRRLFGSLSVEENLRLAADHGRKGHWDLCKLYGLFPILEEMRHQPALSLSGGQQQMVAIGRALVANPSLILFDEISLGLAPVVINDLYAAMPEIIGSGISAILVEQDIERVRRTADILVCLREGRKVLEGSTAAVSQHDITTAYFGERHGESA